VTWRAPQSSSACSNTVTGTGEPVLVVHGAEGGFEQALDMTSPLAQAGFRLIALDLGRGREVDAQGNVYAQRQNGLRSDA
jgi:hypothetical protein